MTTSRHSPHSWKARQRSSDGSRLKRSSGSGLELMGGHCRGRLHAKPVETNKWRNWAERGTMVCIMAVTTNPIRASLSRAGTADGNFTRR